MAVTVKGRIDWRSTTDEEGHRTYKIKWLAKATSISDGPTQAAAATGLPAVNASWVFGNDTDTWAKCYPTLTVTPTTRKEPGLWWDIEQTFSTKPIDRCQDDAIEDPLLEPDIVKGSFVKYTVEAAQDRQGRAIKSSSHEMFRGAAVEFDDNRPTVTITKNVATNPMSLFTPMIDTLNDATLWGISERKVKLSNATWERHLYGSCTYYYTVTYEFDIRDTTDGFDRPLIDEGTRVLRDGYTGTLATDWTVYKDRNGENSKVFLNGAGKPLTDMANPVERLVEYYTESDFTTLGIPATL
jgi:hypothetical protein